MSLRPSAYPPELVGPGLGTNTSMESLTLHSFDELPLRNHPYIETGNGL